MNYNARTACKLTGITYRQLDYWDKTHFIKPSVREAGGSGTLRLYSFIDLVQLRVAKALLDQGTSLQKIRKSVTWIKKNFPDIKEPLSAKKFLTDGKGIFVFTEDSETILDTLSKGQIIMTVALGRIIEAMKGDVEKIAHDKEYTVGVKRRRFKVILHPDLEDGGYWAECPSLPGCASQGETIEEALEMIKDAIEGHLELIHEEAPTGRAKKASA